MDSELKRVVHGMSQGAYPQEPCPETASVQTREGKAKHSADSGAIPRTIPGLPEIPGPKTEVPRPISELPKRISTSPITRSTNWVQATAPADASAALAIIDRDVKACTACKSLVQNRTQTVFGVGDPRARLVFMGEAPGADEDRQGVPFVGRAGQLLDKILEACGLKRSEVYILNSLKCRPPNNRAPEPDEVESCRGFFEGQLEIIRPEFICCLGLVAATALLQSKTSLGSLRGKFHPWRGAKVLVTYHPAYLLRNPSAKKMTWEDLQLLMREMGLEIPDHSRNAS